MWYIKLFQNEEYVINNFCNYSTFIKTIASGSGKYLNKISNNLNYKNN